MLINLELKFSNLHVQNNTKLCEKPNYPQTILGYNQISVMPTNV